MEPTLRSAAESFFSFDRFYEAPYGAMLLALLVVAFPAKMTYAQEAEADTSSQPRGPREVFFSAERSALHIPKKIGRVDFSSSPSEAGSGNGGGPPAIESVQFFKDPSERKGGAQPISGRRVGKQAMTARQKEHFFQLRGRDMQSLWARYRPESIRRVTKPPFDTLAVNERTGEVVELEDMSVHYVVVLQDSLQRRPFVEDADELPGVLGVHLPPKLLWRTHGAKKPERRKN